MANPSITDKEWLDLAWKHFQQHAQQRILYFNYFVIFSTILTTGLVTTFQSNFQAPYLGIGIGLIQALLSYIFWKIDDRNRFLTKHAEKIIKKIEADYEAIGNNSYKLFTEEEIETSEKKKSDKNKFILWQQFSHGQTYKIIFIVFFLIGVIGAIISANNFIHLSQLVNNKQKIEIHIYAIDSLYNMVNNKERNINNTHKEIKNLNLKLDSIQKTIILLQNKIKKQ